MGKREVTDIGPEPVAGAPEADPGAEPVVEGIDVEELFDALGIEDETPLVPEAGPVPIPGAAPPYIPAPDPTYPPGAPPEKPKKVKKKKKKTDPFAERKRLAGLVLARIPAELGTEKGERYAHTCANYDIESKTLTMQHRNQRVEVYVDEYGMLRSGTYGYSLEDFCEAKGGGRFAEAAAKKFGLRGRFRRACADLRKSVFFKPLVTIAAGETALFLYLVSRILEPAFKPGSGTVDGDKCLGEEHVVGVPESGEQPEHMGVYVITPDGDGDVDYSPMYADADAARVDIQEGHPDWVEGRDYFVQDTTVQHIEGDQRIEYYYDPADGYVYTEYEDGLEELVFSENNSERVLYEDEDGYLRYDPDRDACPAGYEQEPAPDAERSFAKRLAETDLPENSPRWYTVLYAGLAIAVGTIGTVLYGYFKPRTYGETRNFIPKIVATTRNEDMVKDLGIEGKIKKLRKNSMKSGGGAD